MQDYGARPLEMTTGALRSRTHRLQVHSLGAADNQWDTIADDSAFGLLFDGRWRNVEHMLAVAASENNEELVYVIFDHAAKRSRDIDAIRLIRLQPYPMHKMNSTLPVNCQRKI